MLVRQYLLGRTEGMSAPQLAAFLDGWSSAIDLFKRADLCLPDGSEELREALRRLVAEIETAQELALADDEAPA